MDQQLHVLSEGFIKPDLNLSQSKVHLTPWDLAMLSVQYIQKGLLYRKPPQFHIAPFLSDLKDSLAAALAHFHPLAGRLETIENDNSHGCHVVIDFAKGPGARFIYARMDVQAADVVEATYVLPLVNKLFDHDRCVNLEGHERPLVSVQVTDLLDAVFIGCSMNHAVCDGTSYWHFLNMWSEIFETKRRGLECASISKPPLLERWFPEGHSPIITLPKTPQEFAPKYIAPKLKVRFFHFSPESVAKLKAKANKEANTAGISSFQALSALIWRVISRARRLEPDQTTRCILVGNLRPRLNPPIPETYFGNMIGTMTEVATAGELLHHNLGFAALTLHKAIKDYTDQKTREFLNQWLQAPKVYQFRHFDPCSVVMGSSPRFDMYCNEFGLGKPLGIRSGGSDNKFDGRVSSYPGYEGKGSVDVEVCLTPQNMEAFECDAELSVALSCKT